MMLNRGGRWGDAVRLGTSFLRTHPDAALGERCRIRAGLLLAQARQRRIDSARATLAAFDRECASVPELPEAREVAEARPSLVGDVASTSGAGTAAHADREPPPAPGTAPAPSTDTFWQQGDAAALGLDVGALERHRALCEQTAADACLVVFRGRIVQEWYGARYARPAYAMSSTKSVTGLLVGMLIADGKIRGVDQRVCDFLPTWCDGIRGRVTLRHLLTMTSGLPEMRDSSVGFVRRKNAYVSRLTPTAEPGTRWVYSNEGVQLLSPILSKAAGEPIHDYARRRLFEPLGMGETRLHVLDGEAWTYADMETTPRDVARLGLLMLQRGAWGAGEQIVPAWWIAASTQPSQALNPRYGLLWWLDPEAGAFAAHGHLDTSLHVLPHAGLIIVRMQAKPAPGVREGTYESVVLPLLSRIVPAADSGR